MLPTRLSFRSESGSGRSDGRWTVFSPLVGGRVPTLPEIGVSRTRTNCSTPYPGMRNSLLCPPPAPPLQGDRFPDDGVGCPPSAPRATRGRSYRVRFRSTCDCRLESRGFSAVRGVAASSSRARAPAHATCYWRRSRTWTAAATGSRIASQHNRTGGRLTTPQDRPGDSTIRKILVGGECPSERWRHRSSRAYERRPPARHWPLLVGRPGERLARHLPSPLSYAVLLPRNSRIEVPENRDRGQCRCRENSPGY